MNPNDHIGNEYDAMIGSQKEQRNNGTTAPCSAWMPIETAPNDGITWIIGYEEDTDEVGILIFDSNPEEECPDEHADVWTDAYRVWDPTHWMPLPDSPNMKGTRCQPFDTDQHQRDNGIE